MGDSNRDADSSHESSVDVNGVDNSELAPYGGLLGAFPYAFRDSESTVFRSYVVTCIFLAVLIGGLFLLAIPVWIAATLRTPASVTLSRSFLLLLWLLVFIPLVAPVLLVARRHRRHEADPWYDSGVAISGYLFVIGTYLGLVIGAPAGSRTAPQGEVAVLVSLLYELPRLGGLLPPLIAVLLMALVHFHFSE